MSVTCLLPSSRVFYSRNTSADSGRETPDETSLLLILKPVETRKDGFFLLFCYLLAVNALQSELHLVAGQTVVVVVLLDEALGADGLLAVVADEAVLMPSVVLVLHLFGAWWVKGRGKCTSSDFIWSGTLHVKPH